ncbi:MAG: GxxExxY protein [Deltaproteobacteria bacterium]|nr:GxxExxY protein [Deltaproteobacteria bacterium]
MRDEDVTERILAASFEVINELGAGFLESVYEKSLLIALRENGMAAESQVPVPVYFRGKSVGDFFADIIVEDRILLELKAVRNLAPEHLAQVLNYLKGTGLKTGLLINFGNKKLEYRRLNNRTEEIVMV